MEKYFDFEHVVENDVSLQVNTPAPAAFETSAGAVDSPLAPDALGRVPDASTSFGSDSLLFGPSTLFSTVGFLDTMGGFGSLGSNGLDFGGLGGFGQDLFRFTDDVIASSASGIQGPSLGDLVEEPALPRPIINQFGVIEMVPLRSNARSVPQDATFACLDPSTLLCPQPELNTPGAVTDAGSSPATHVKTELFANDLESSLLPFSHPSFAPWGGCRDDSSSNDSSSVSPFHYPMNMMPTPALTPSTTPAPSAVDSAGPATPFHHLTDFDDEEAAFIRSRGRLPSRRATPFAFSGRSSGASSRCSGSQPCTPETTRKPLLPAFTIHSRPAAGEGVKKESDEQEILGCLRTKRLSSVKVPWPERRKKIDERITVLMMVNGRRKLMYQCDYCGKLLGRHPDLYRHEKTHFITEKVLCCDIVKDLDGNVMEGCGSTFSRLDALERHRKGVCERQRADVEARLLSIRNDDTKTKSEKEAAKQEIKRLAAKRALPKAKQAAAESALKESGASTALPARRRLSRC